jgi:hypothetical protein
MVFDMLLPVGYMLALSLYVSAACAVWVICALLGLVRATRRTARRVAVSMLASFPSVILFQVVAFPFCLVFVLVAGVLLRLIGSYEPAVDFIKLLALFPLFLSMGLFALASLCGFWTGWSVAWDVSAGVSFATALRTDPLLKRARLIVVRFARRRRGNREAPTA